MTGLCFFFFLFYGCFSGNRWSGSDVFLLLASDNANAKSVQQFSFNSFGELQERRQKGTFRHHQPSEGHSSGRRLDVCSVAFQHRIDLWMEVSISVQFSRSVMSNSLWPHELQHTRPSCPSPTPRVQPNPCPLSRWCHLTISSSVVSFSSCPQSLPASGSFQISQLFTLGG